MNNKSQYTSGVSGLHEFVIRPGGLVACPKCHNKNAMELIEVHTGDSCYTLRRSVCCHSYIWTAHKPPRPIRQNNGRSGKTAEKTVEQVAMLIKEQPRSKYQLAEKMGVSKWTIEKAVGQLTKTGKVITEVHPTRYVWNA